MYIYIYIYYIYTKIKKRGWEYGGSLMFQKYKKDALYAFALDNKEFCVTIFTDLLKAFDWICHDLLIAKLNAYGFNRSPLKLIYDYLSDRS